MVACSSCRAVARMTAAAAAVRDVLAKAVASVGGNKPAKKEKVA